MEEIMLIGVSDIQEQFMPGVSKRKIRKMLNSHPEELHVKVNGRKLLVSKMEFVNYLKNPNQKVIG